MGFAKLDSGIVSSSIWSEPPATRVVWITMLAMADRTGLVKASASGIQRFANVSQAETDKALDVLQAPDPDSRSKDHDGRRIKRVDGGWQILNHAKYREFSYSESYEAVRKREYREKTRLLGQKDRDNLGTPGDNSGHSASASASVSDSESGKEGSGEGKKRVKKVYPPGHWRLSFENYTAELQRQWAWLINDEEWLEDRARYHPGLDVALSLEKALNDFWGQEAGWKWKKKKAGEEFDLKATLTNAISDRRNQVWKPKTKDGAYAKTA